MTVDGVTQQLLSPDMDEHKRLLALRRYDILDTNRELEYDDIVKIAAHVCGTPMSLISFVDADRQWFKARLGVSALETPRDWSICHETIRHDEVLVVKDASQDVRFKDSPLVAGEMHLRFYAGAPLKTSDGHIIGTVCVLDNEPREFSDGQREVLSALARQVMRQLELRLALKLKELSEERFSLALSISSLVGTWDWHIASDKVYADEGFARIYSVDIEEARNGAPIAQFFRNIHFDDQDMLRVSIGEAIASGEDFVEEYRVIQSDGSIRWLLTRGKCQYVDGKPNRFPGVAVDITSRKEVEFRQLVLAELDVSLSQHKSIPEIVHAAAELLGKTLEASRAGYAEVDPTGQYARVTDDWRRDGQPTIAATHRFADYGSFVSVLHKGELLAIDDMHTDERASTNVSQKHTADGIGVRALVNVPLMEDGKLVALIFIHDNKPRKWKKGELDFIQEVGRRTWDSARRMMVHEALRKSEELTRSIVENTPDGVKVMDINGNLMSMNLIGAQHMDIDERTEWYNKPWVSFWQGEPLEKAQKAIDAAKIGVMTQFDGFRHTLKGTPKWWEVIVTPMFDRDGSVGRILALSRDITSRYESEQALIEARNAAESANIAKTEFLANMSHEIRTPMNAIIGLSNILAMTQPLTPKQKQFISTLQLSADSLLVLINDLLDIAKIEARAIELEKIPFNLTHLVQEIISIMTVRAQEKGLEFTLDDAAVRNLRLSGDPTRLRQIIMNLCSNAVKFTDSGTIHLSITAEKTEQEGVQTICISVTDTGIGIEQQNLELIFQKFMQADTTINRKYGGTGLGLAITKTLAEIMGGYITVESESGKGSTFTVCVPLEVMDLAEVSEEATAHKAIYGGAHMRANKPKILLVEDYEPNIIVAGTFLEQFGYDFEVAKSGLEALEKIKQMRFDAALMDVQMHGMNGLEATRHIREHEKQTGAPYLHIIGMTAHALAGDRERCLGVGMDDYISKPFVPEELDEKLSLAVRRG